MKIAIVAQHANPLHLHVGASPRPDDAGLGELTRILAGQGAQGDRVPAEAQADVPDRAGLCGGLYVVHIPIGAAGKRGDAELLARVPRSVTCCGRAGAVSRPMSYTPSARPAGSLVIGQLLPSSQEQSPRRPGSSPARAHSPRTSATPDPEARHVPAPAPVPSS